MKRTKNSMKELRDFIGIFSIFDCAKNGKIPHFPRIKFFPTNTFKSIDGKTK
jgi:hypothetical protein